MKVSNCLGYRIDESGDNRATNAEQSQATVDPVLSDVR